MNRKDELVAQLGHDRLSIMAGKEQLKAKFNLKRRVKLAVTENPKAIAAGTALLAAATGLFTKRLFGSHKKAASRGILSVALLALIKPYAKAWAINQGTAYITKKIEQSRSQSA